MIIPLYIVMSGMVNYIVGLNVLDEYNVERFAYRYMFYCLIILISFYIGSMLGSKSIKQKVRKTKCESILQMKPIDRLMFPVFLFTSVVTFMNRGSLFQGYIDGYDPSFLGIIATAQLLFLFWMIYELIIYKRTSRFVILSVFLFSIVLLGMGSRMYVLIPCISFLIYLLEYRVISVNKIIYASVVGVFAFVSIGLLRFGNDITTQGLLYIGLAEPCYTWITAESMFQYTREFEWLSFPYNYLTSFFNFIPSLIFPNKAEYIKPMSLPYDAPGGATNFIVSLISNFGIIGSCIFTFAIGWVLSYIRINKTNFFWTTYYICICAVMPFQLFRDELTIINKVVFMNFLVVPLVVKYIVRKLYRRTVLRIRL